MNMFLELLIAYAISHWIDPNFAEARYNNYCQNLYFQPNAYEKMQAIDCNYEKVEETIRKVRSVKY